MPNFDTLKEKNPVTKSTVVGWGGCEEKINTQQGGANRQKN